MANQNQNGTPADGKRLAIDKAQQLTLLEVLGASLIVGASIVIGIFLFKYIRFNTTIITEKGNAISEYEESLINLGVCDDTDRNMQLNDREINGCRTHASMSSSSSNSLSYKILTNLAQNESLESVARLRDAETCFEADGKTPIDFISLFDGAETERDREQYLSLQKTCSALRVIPDALPAVLNTEAMMASANEIFTRTGVEPTRLAPSDDRVNATIKGVGVIPMTLRVESTSEDVVSLINNLERSIRAFDIRVGNFEWDSDGLNFQASAYAYYLNDNDGLEKDETIYATRKARRSK